jgi:hypothetical protein
MLHVAAYIANNRPLTMRKLEDNTYLTPNQFLFLNTNNIFSLQVKDRHKPLPYTQRIEALHQKAKELWNAFVLYYLPTIRFRSKWISRAPKILVNDIVMTVDTDSTNSWRIGRVIEVKEGSNKQTRRCTILLGKNKKVDLKVLKKLKNLKQIVIQENYSKVERATANVVKLNLTD